MPQTTVPPVPMARPRAQPPAPRRAPGLPPAGLLLAAVLATGAAQAGEFDCMLEPRMMVDVRPAVEGLIEQVPVDRGDRIRAGQTLVVLDTGLEKASLELARYRATMVGAVKSGESRVAYAQLKLQRREKLADGQFISLQDRDEAAAERRLAEAELVQAQENQRVAALEQVRAAEQLRLRTLKSPFSGVVMDRMAHPGDLADNRDLRKPLLRIADTSMLHVEVLLPAAAYRRIAVGTAMDVSPDAPVGGRYSARVKSVDPVIDAASGTFRLRLELPNPELKLPAGIPCKVEVPGLDSKLGGSLGAARNRAGASAAR